MGRSLEEVMYAYPIYVLLGLLLNSQRRHKVSQTEKATRDALRRDYGEKDWSNDGELQFDLRVMFCYKVRGICLLGPGLIPVKPQKHH